MKKRFLLLLPILVLALSACTSEENSTNTTVPANNAAPTENTETTAATGSLDVMMTNFKFSPSTLTAKAGETIVINLTSEGGSHDFVIDELGVKSQTLSSGKTQTIEITIPADATSGTTYEYYCSIDGHRALGMVGTLTVAE